MSGRIRLLTVGDVPDLTELVRVNRQFLAPWSPLAEDASFTEEGQRAMVEDILDQHRRGMAFPMVIVDEPGPGPGPGPASGRVVGRITLNGIVRRSFQSCSLGYWVGEAENGRGLATVAVREAIGLAFGELGLHRIEAGTMRHNVRSQRVLERNGFTRIGVAREYLKIAGQWQDHMLFQLVAGDLGGVP